MRASRAITGVGAIIATLLMAVAPVGASSTPPIVNVAVGAAPGEALFEPRTGDIYVLNLLDNSASIIDGSTNAVIATVPAGVTPDVAAFDLANGRIYITDFSSSQVAVLNGSTGATVTSISLGTSFGPQGIAYDQRNGQLFAVNSGPVYLRTPLNSNTISVIDGSSNTLVATIVDSIAPLSNTFLIGAIFDPQTGNIYLTDEGYGIQVLSGATHQFIANIVTPANYFATYDPLNGLVYAYGPGSPATLVAINGATNAIVASVALPSQCSFPGSGTVDLRNGYIYLACSGTPNNVTVFNPVDNSIVGSFSIGGSFFFTVVDAFDVRTGAVYVPNPTSNDVAVFSP